MDDPESAANMHTLISLTEPSKGFRNAEQGLGVTISTPYLLSRIRKAKTIQIDITYKISTNNLLICVIGIVDCYGTFIPCCFAIVKRQNAEAFGKPLKEINAYTLKYFQHCLTPVEFGHDNDDAIYLAAITQGPPHWPALFARGSIYHVNCAVHLDANLSSSKGRAKFEHVGKRKIVTLTCTQIKKELKERHVDIPRGVTKKAQLLALLEDSMESEPSSPPSDPARPAQSPSVDPNPSVAAVSDSKSPADPGVCPASESNSTVDQGFYDLYHAPFMTDLHKLTWILQRSDQLQTAFDLLKQKWQDRLPRVIKCLEDGYWGDKKGFWQRCRTLMNHSNGLERYNRSLKDLFTLHELVPYCVLLPKFAEFVAGQSVMFAQTPIALTPYALPDSRSLPRLRTRVLNLWKRACHDGPQIAKGSVASTLDPSVLLIRNSSYHDIQIDKNQLLHFEWVYNLAGPMDDLETFDQFVARRTLFYKLRVNKAYPFDSTCTCPYYMERHTCKHVLGYAISLGVDIPIDCDYRRVTPGKRKAGRPAKLSHFLIKEPLEQAYEDNAYSADADCHEFRAPKAFVLNLIGQIDRTKIAEVAEHRQRSQVHRDQLLGGPESSNGAASAIVSDTRPARLTLFSTISSTPRCNLDTSPFQVASASPMGPVQKAQLIQQLELIMMQLGKV